MPAQSPLRKKSQPVSFTGLVDIVKSNKNINNVILDCNGFSGSVFFGSCKVRTRWLVLCIYCESDKLIKGTIPIFC